MCICQEISSRKYAQNPNSGRGRAGAPAEDCRDFPGFTDQFSKIPGAFGVSRSASRGAARGAALSITRRESGASEESALPAPHQPRRVPRPVARPVARSGPSHKLLPVACSR
eukprot:gene15883-biopygen699